MPWPAHAATAYHAASDHTKEVLLDIAKRAGWGDVSTIVEYKPPEKKKLLRTLPLVNDCLHRGKKNPPAKPGCGSCSTWDCTVYGQVKLDFCMGKCHDWKSKSDALPAVEVTSKSIRIDHTNFIPEITGLRFNSSIIESGTGYIYAFRNGWRGSNIYAARMNHYFEPTGEWAKLELTNKGARVGREDCRLFRLNGKLHVSYTGYTGRNTNVLFARINEDTLKVEDVFFPQIVGRQSWEKNIVMFDYKGIAHGIYSTNPHKILRIEGNKTEWAYETPFTGSWAGGHMRGGASPVMHAGLWYHFFHGSTQYQGRRVYNMGLVTFKPEPPFEIVSYTPEPIDVADTNVAHDNYCHVIFPGGAVYKNGRWIIAHGIHDRWSELRFYDSAWIESQLVPMEKVGHGIIV